MTCVELVQFIRNCLKELNEREVMFLLTHMHASDLQKSGRYSYNELLIAFRCVGGPRDEGDPGLNEGPGFRRGPRAYGVPQGS